MAATSGVVVHRDAVSSWWSVGTLAVVSVLVLGVALVRRRRGQPVATGRRPRVWPAAVAAVLGLVLAAGVGVNAVIGWAPDVDGLRMRVGAGTGRPALLPVEDVPVARPDAPVAAAGPADGVGAVGEVDVPVPAELRMPEAATWVYTPPGFDPSGGTRYPTLYVLHGDPGGSVDWMAAGLPGLLDDLITSGRVRPMIVIAPDVNAVDIGESSCLDSVHGGSQVETYLTSVLVPWVDAHYPVADAWGYRGVGGMSAGAFCALDQGLRHPDLYGTVLAVMPYPDPGAGGTHQLGSRAAIEAHSPGLYADTVPLPHRLGLLLAYGQRDPDPLVGATARDLAARFGARGVDVELLAMPGQGHTWTAATTAAPAGLLLFERQMADADVDAAVHARAG